MRERIEHFLDQYGMYIVPLAGLLLLLGALFNWKWITTPDSGEKRFMRFIYRKFGQRGYRIMMGIEGAFILVLSLVYFYLIGRR